MARSIPERYTSVSFDTPPIAWLDEAVVARLRTYCNKMDDRLAEGRGLWLGGDTGTGKTSAAALLVKQAAERRYSAGFHPLPELLMRLRRTFDDRRDDEAFSDEREHDLIDELSALDLLVIDDMGAVKTTPWVLQQLYVIINRRYNERRSTVITTDLDRDALTQAVGWRVVSRLVECTGKPVIFSGPDRRLEHADEDDVSPRLVA